MRAPLATRALVAMILLPAGAAPLAAQPLGRAHATMTVQVRTVVRSQLVLRRTAALELLGRSGDTLTFVLPVEVAANEAWTLRAVRGVGTAALLDLQVLDFSGRWWPLGADAVVVIAAHDPCDPTAFQVVLRTTDARRAAALQTLTLELAPAVR